MRLCLDAERDGRFACFKLTQATMIEDQVMEAVDRVGPRGGYLVMSEDYGWPAAVEPHRTPERFVTVEEPEA